MQTAVKSRIARLYVQQKVKHGKVGEASRRMRLKLPVELKNSIGAYASGTTTDGTPTFVESRDHGAGEVDGQN